MPADFAPWPRVYASFARWRDTGLATELHDRLREAVRRIRWRKISLCCVEGFECAEGARAAEESSQCGPAVALGPTGSATRPRAKTFP
ncbi:transposase [Streptomyces collinus]